MPVLSEFIFSLAVAVHLLGHSTQEAEAESEASFVYRASSRTARSIQINPVLWVPGMKLWFRLDGAFQAIGSFE